jgi:hypothetical protein
LVGGKVLGDGEERREGEEVVESMRIGGTARKVN